MKTIYGPVLSRRLGRSLGVDVVPYKTCSFDCIYCQLGRTTLKTVERREYVPKSLVLRELEEFFKDGEDIDFVTFSGSGEPTLNSKLGELIEATKGLTDVPVAVITNSSLLSDGGVLHDLRGADVILPSLDAATQETFKRVNRPHESLTLRGIIEGLKKLRATFEGEIWLEIMLVKGVNDGLEELRAMSELLEEIKPERVQLNTVVRPPQEGGVEALSFEELENVRRTLSTRGVSVEVLPERGELGVSAARAEELLELLRRRPCTLEDVAETLGVHINEALKCVEALKAKAEGVTEMWHGGRRYFVVAATDRRRRRRGGGGGGDG